MLLKCSPALKGEGMLLAWKDGKRDRLWACFNPTSHSEKLTEFRRCRNYRVLKRFAAVDTLKFIQKKSICTDLFDEHNPLVQATL